MRGNGSSTAACRSSTRTGEQDADRSSLGAPLLLESRVSASVASSAVMHTDYLERILNAQVYDVAIETPLDLAPGLSARIGNRILLKREDLQPVFSFKLRGAYNKIVHLSAEKLKRGVICASAGNHAQGVALAASKVGCRAVIVMPTTTPQIKIHAVQARGGEVVLAGDSYDDAYAHALELEKVEKLSFVHPFDDPDVIAGQGTLGLELLRQNPTLDVIVVPVGGGGLIGGVGCAVKEQASNVEVVGVQTARLPSMKAALGSSIPVELPASPTLADGIAVRTAGSRTLPLVQRYVDQMVTVDEDEIAAAILTLLEGEKTVAEGAGAVALAALLQGNTGHRGKNIAVLVSGGNLDTV